MSKIVLFTNGVRGRCWVPMRIESPLVELTGRSGYRGEEEWKEVRWFSRKYSLLDIIFNREGRLECRIEWVPATNILKIEDESF